MLPDYDKRQVFAIGSMELQFLLPEYQKTVIEIYDEGALIHVA